MDLRSPGEEAVHLWLKFNIEPDGIANMLFPNLKKEEFDGDWKLEIFWNKKKVAASNLTVRCV